MIKKLILLLLRTDSALGLALKARVFGSWKKPVGCYSCLRTTKAPVGKSKEG